MIIVFVLSLFFAVMTAVLFLRRLDEGNWSKLTPDMARLKRAN